MCNIVHNCGIFKLSQHQITPLNTGKTSKVVLKIIIFSFLFYVIINVIYSLDDKSGEKVAGNPKIIAIFAL
nr:MAG TPA: hypothetical protein [Caudoviricetes sp.]